MGKVGSLGKISFYVKTVKGLPKILSFSEMSGEAATDYEEHPVNGKKARLEFIAPQLEQLSITISARKQFGVDPLKIKKKLHAYKNNGTACTLMVGGKKIGTYKWVIENVSDTYQTISVNGEITEMDFTITLKEWWYKKKKGITYASPTKPVSNGSAKDPKKKSYDTYTIKKGDTLWALAKKYYGDGRKYTKIYKANRNIIKDPSKLTIGWKIRIPK